MAVVLCGRRTDQWPRRLYMQLIPQQLLVRLGMPGWGWAGDPVTGHCRECCLASAES